MQGNLSLSPVRWVDVPAEELLLVLQSLQMGNMLSCELKGELSRSKGSNQSKQADGFTHLELCGRWQPCTLGHCRTPIPLPTSAASSASCALE